MIDRVPEELWTEVHKQRTKPSKNTKLQNGYLRKPYKELRKEEKLKAKEKRKDISIRMQSSKE